MLTNSYGWRFLLAGDCLEVYIPEHKADFYRYPVDVPYDVLLLEDPNDLNNIKRLVQNLPEYS